MSIGSPFDARTEPLNVRRQWRQWSATFAASAHAPHIDIEVNAIRDAAPSSTSRRSSSTGSAGRMRRGSWIVW
ncbi:hypothetical protein BH24CHL9_BH24CHL9_03400 [soil metagenome]